MKNRVLISYGYLCVSTEMDGVEFRENRTRPRKAKTRGGLRRDFFFFGEWITRPRRVSGGNFCRRRTSWHAQKVDDHD